MNCPACDSSNDRVARTDGSNHWRIRRRVCRDCGHAWRTIELAGSDELLNFQSDAFTGTTRLNVDPKHRPLVHQIRRMLWLQPAP